jgi:ATP-dependent Lhr-like helicase
VTSHHGSLARKHRLDAERRLKDGSLRALVATASLELGIDIGQVDLTCQLGSPRSIAAFLQRVGRSGHDINAVPQGRLFPMSRDDLVECAALLDAVHRRELDEICVPRFPLDVLSQQLVAEVSAREWELDDLYAAFTRAWPYRDLPRAEFDRLIRMLADGFSTRRGRRGAHLHLDAVNGRVRPRKGARLMAITNGGAIPDQFDYDVVLLPQQISVGTLNEDFAFESLPGDIFQLGNTSYRILRVESGKVLVEDAKGQPPNIPFWFGEAPGRSDELSVAVSRLRQHVEVLLETGKGSSVTWLQEHLGLPAAAAEQLTDYLAGARAALSVLLLSCRPRRSKTASYFLWGRRIVFPWTRCPVTSTLQLCETCWCRRFWRLRCSRRTGVGVRPLHWPSGATAMEKKCRLSFNAAMRRICWQLCFRISWLVPRISSDNERCRIILLSTRPFMIASMS